MKNIELKILIKDFRKIIPSLRRMGAEFSKKLKQVDIYYSCKDNRLKIRVINNKIFELISYQRPNKNGAKISDYHVKKIKPDKINCIKSNLENRFGERIVVKKQRSLWIYKNTRIHLDRVDNLGKFLELETSIKRTNLEQAKKEHWEIVRSLNLSNYRKYNKSYSDLLASVSH